MLPLLILGASARAAASSAARADFAPTAVDLFADRDLAARFPAFRVEPRAYPDGLADLAATLPPMPWIYTGALENHPDLVDRIARTRPLLGVGGEALRAVRDPARWTAALREAGLPHLAVRDHRDDPPDSGDWLRKPRTSAMGRGILCWTLGEGPIPHGWFLQSLARGEPLAAVFVADGRSTRLAGVTRQLLRRSPDGIKSAYAGSVGPISLDEPTAERVAAIGEVLATSFGLRGLFGVDFLIDAGTPRAVEINPRYTASVEVLEAGLGVSLLAEHVRAFGVGGPGDPPMGCGLAAKVILRARRSAVVPGDWSWSNALDPDPTVADIPAPGTILRPGDPVLSVLARGEAGVGRLGSALRLWGRRIAAWPAPGSDDLP